jgi:hypothetical protein
VVLALPVGLRVVVVVGLRVAVVAGLRVVVVAPTGLRVAVVVPVARTLRLGAALSLSAETIRFTAVEVAALATGPVFEAVVDFVRDAIPVFGLAIPLVFPLRVPRGARAEVEAMVQVEEITGCIYLSVLWL